MMNTWVFISNQGNLSDSLGDSSILQDKHEEEQHETIAIDAMGGDNAPQALVEGVNQALRDFSDIELVLWGMKPRLSLH